jgi:hypothetical protein
MGVDFNDVHGTDGPEAVAEELLNAKPARPRLVVCSAAELLALNLPPREMLLAPWLESQSLTMVHAWRGLGKTHMALGIAYALASGGEVMGWRATRAVETLYVDGEMPGAALKGRVARIVASSETEADPSFLRFVTPDLQTNGVMPNLGSQEGQQALDAVLGDAEVVVLDNLSCLVRGGKENEAESWQPVADWCLRQRSQGRSVVMIHHSGKGGQQRGTSKREDLLDTVLALKRPGDYRPDEGARFEVHFEKARALFGQDVSPFEAALETLADGRQAWAVTGCEAASDAKMIELAELGLSQAEIARELVCHRSTVLRALKKAEADGRYRPKPKRSGNVVHLRGARDDD